MSIVVAPSASQAALPRAAAALSAPQCPAPRPLVVAADGREDVRPAMQVAAAVARRLGLPVHVLAAIEPAASCGGHAPGGTPADWDVERAAAAREVMRGRVRDVVCGGPAWPVEAVLGPPMQTIAERAAERAAELVLVGAGWHDRSARPFGTERALEVARAGHTPVLVAGPDADGAFRRAVVGVDFDPASVRAAELACRLLSAGGTLSLVYVKQRLDWGGAAAEAWDAVCSEQVAGLFRRLVAALRGGAPFALRGRAVDDADAAWPGRRDVVVGSVTLVGDPADELVAYAERVGADFVACGTRPGSGADRRYSTGVSAGVARRLSAELTECSVLVCPPPAAPARADRRLTGTAVALDAAAWRLTLDGFWRRNSGRRAAVEVDDPQLGARRVAHAVALVGASYDPRTRQAELMLGGTADGPAQHLTRMMPDVRSVAVLTGRDGRDVALRVEHGCGQTLVTFLPAGPV